MNENSSHQNLEISSNFPSIIRLVKVHLIVLLISIIFDILIWSIILSFHFFILLLISIVAQTLCLLLLFSLLYFIKPPYSSSSIKIKIVKPLINSYLISSYITFIIIIVEYAKVSVTLNKEKEKQFGNIFLLGFCILLHAVNSISFVLEYILIQNKLNLIFPNQAGFNAFDNMISFRGRSGSSTMISDYLDNNSHLSNFVKEDTVFIFYEKENKKIGSENNIINKEEEDNKRIENDLSVNIKNNYVNEQCNNINSSS